ncbi:hypothetical protein OBBRIDRAFT_792163 [Obba rivulosa]|uniref:SigF-like NTF2-like domain-containing protein n=1 Tax=Obba rivulosa TaxID=1052685 RepID=A0A8E2B0F5_9APHY|nr:hypothetical protein OBBRIDRAFT_792163 [Obba rivulosa]
MEDPASEIRSVIQLLTAAVNPSIQAAALERYFTPDASFRHPLAYVPSAPASRDSILAIYKWYRILSPHIKMDVSDVVYDDTHDHPQLFVKCEQVFHIRWSPLKPAPVPLTTHVMLRAVPATNDGPTLYQIFAQEDFYHPDDFVAFVLPPARPVVRLALQGSGIACAILAKIFETLGYWRTQPGEGGEGVSPQPAGEQRATDPVETPSVRVNGHAHDGETGKEGEGSDKKED